MRSVLPLFAIVLASPACVLFESIEDPVLADGSVGDDAAQDSLPAETAGDAASSDADDTAADSWVDSTVPAVDAADSAVASADVVADDGTIVETAPDAILEASDAVDDVGDATGTPSDTSAVDSAVDAVGDVQPDAREAAADSAASGIDAAPCDSAICISPPVATCADHATRRSFASAGTCSGGACSYAPLDTPCAQGQFCTAGACSAPNSCTAGLTCNGESCCASLLVPGGTFSRSYDAVYYTDAKYAATVSSFRLDKYEVTVGRFRKFVDAVVAGWTPPADSGKHAHLAGGAGLNGGTERGWDVAWNNTNLPTSQATWSSASHLLAEPNNATWTANAGASESRPINNVNWFQAYAFCIWDGGFLPSESEWNYAAAGGTEQRVYPWGATEPGPDTQLAIYGCHYPIPSAPECPGLLQPAPVGSVPAGNGRWGHSDLAGNVMEWTLDWRATYASGACSDCANLSYTDRVIVVRGGSFIDISLELRSGTRASAPQDGELELIGFRCARPR